MSETRLVGGSRISNDSDVKFVGGANEGDMSILSSGGTDADLDADVRILQGGRPFTPGGITTVDHTTIEGDGTIARPLHVVGGGGGGTVHVDNVSIAGDGSVESPLHTLADGTAVLTDGTTISGTGVTGSPLHVVGGGTVHADGTSIAGDGSVGAPLHTVADGTAVLTDGTTIAGTGVTGSPLHVIGGGTVHTDASLAGDGSIGAPLHTVADKTAVLTDGVTITGSGVTGDPLIATGGGPGSTAVLPFSYTVTGAEPDLAQITIPISPSQPNTAYQALVTQGVHAFLYGMSIITKATNSLVLQLTANATAGDVFDFSVQRIA